MQTLMLEMLNSLPLHVSATICEVNNLTSLIAMSEQKTFATVIKTSKHSEHTKLVSVGVLTFAETKNIPNLII